MGRISAYGGAETAPGANAAPIQSMAALPERPLSGTCGISQSMDICTGARGGCRGARRVRSRRAQLPRAALIVSRSELIVASTAEGSYPQCAMQLAHRGSLPRPYESQ